MGNCCKKPRRVIHMEPEYNHHHNHNNNNNNNNNNSIYSFFGSECIICMENPVQAAILDCGHLQFCIRCLNTMVSNTDQSKDYLNYCPVCRKIIKGYVTFSPNFYLKVT
jgi:hypothetical protein